MELEADALLSRRDCKDRVAAAAWYMNCGVFLTITNGQNRYNLLAERRSQWHPRAPGNEIRGRRCLEARESFDRTGGGMPPLRNVKQADAARAFLRLGGRERRTRKNYRMVTMPNGTLLSIPSGTLKVGLLRKLIRLAEISVDDFEEAL